MPTVRGGRALQLGGDAVSDLPPLPPELLWIYPLAPLVAAPVLVDSLFETELHRGLHAVAALYLPFFTFSAAAHLAHRFLLPPLLRRYPRPWHRWALNAATATVVPVALAPAILPLFRRLVGVPVGQLQFAATSVAISWIFTFPAVAVQRARQRARDERRRADAEREAGLRAQLQALQARTQPHFLFNTLNLAAALIPEDPALAERTLERLADLFRYALTSGDATRVTVADEVEMVRNYLAVQALRFGDRLNHSVELDPAAAEVRVPPLVLQPLVENALRHGLEQRRGGRVVVRVQRIDANLRFEVRDDGPGPDRSAATPGTQTSLSEMARRLDLAYGAAASLSLLPAEGGGCLARLVLPG